jgi:hypothetical protein
MPKRVSPRLLIKPMGRPPNALIGKEKVKKVSFSLDKEAARVIEILDGYEAKLRSRFVCKLLSQVRISDLKKFIEEEKLN